MVAGIYVDVYPFLIYSDLTCHLEDTRINTGCSALALSKQTKLGSSDQDASPSACSYFSSMLCMKMCLYS